MQCFDVVLLDMWSLQLVQRPGGRTNIDAQWARDLNVQSAVDYVGLGGYLEQPGFQCFISMRAEVLHAQGVHAGLMK